MAQLVEGPGFNSPELHKLSVVVHTCNHMLKRKREEDQKFQVILGYIRSLRRIWARDPVFEFFKGKSKTDPANLLSYTQDSYKQLKKSCSKTLTPKALCLPGKTYSEFEVGTHIMLVNNSKPIDGWIKYEDMLQTIHPWKITKFW